MKGFKSLNRVINPTAYRRSRKLSVPLARLGGQTAQAQMRANRHFIAEHPKDSDAWHVKDWQGAAANYPVACAMPINAWFDEPMHMMIGQAGNIV